MKNSVKDLLLYAMTIALLCLGTACGGPHSNDVPIAPSADMEKEAPANPGEELSGDKPTVPKDVAEGIEYLYDFTFSERYDSKVTGDFSLTLPEDADPISGTLFLLEKYHNMLYQVREYIHNGDGILPYMQKSYWYTFETGDLVIGTNDYEPDGVEYISCVWTNIAGAKTNLNVAVGSTEKEVLTAYTDDLYYIDEMGGAEPALSEPNEDYACTFDSAYVWQPYVENDVRDITFYMKDGRVVAIEAVQPYELRYVYGYDSDAGLQYANEQREALN